MGKAYKIMRGMDEVNRDLLVTKSQNTKSKGHLTKLVGDRFTTKKRKYFFIQCGVNLEFSAREGGGGR